MTASEHLLQCLSEDASRVIQVSLLGVQRGLDNVAPKASQSKREKLVEELNGVCAIVDLIEASGMFSFDLLAAEKLAVKAAAFNGIRVERYLLTTLAKRFADVVEWASKAARFGPNDSSPGVRLTNSQQVQQRLVEAFVVVRVLQEVGSLPDPYLSRQLQDLRKAKIQGWLDQEITSS